MERALRAFADNPANRDVLLAQTAFQVAELHGQMLAAFAAISQGGLGGLKDLIGGSLFGRKGK